MNLYGIPWDPRIHIILDHLDPGKYIFRVTGTDAITLGIMQ